MKPTVIIGITVKDEERVLASYLVALRAAVEFAEARLPVILDPVVILDDCTDNSAQIAREHDVRSILSSGGIVEAQRLVANHPPFVIFSDADILIARPAIAALCEVMLREPSLQVAYASKSPLPPGRQSLLAQALYCYNRLNGFQFKRRYFNGKLFAIRDWQVPTLEQLKPRLVALPVDRFYHYHAGMRIDDIYLSRDILHRHGEAAIREIEEAQIQFRPPETFAGMFHTYRRMRLEIERLNRLFPETVPVHQQRGYDWDAVRSASRRDRFLWRFFRFALGICQLRFFLEKTYYQRFSSQFCPAWPTIQESKVPFNDTNPQA